MNYEIIVISSSKSCFIFYFYIPKEFLKLRELFLKIKIILKKWKW